MVDTQAQTAERFVKVDPQSIQDALRLFFQPTRTGDLRTDFYSVYQKEVTEYDTNFVKRYEENLNITLIFTGLFSGICSTFVARIQQKLAPDPGDRSLEYLKAILKTLQNSNSSAEEDTTPPAWPGPSSATVMVSALLHATLFTSLFAALLAMLGKQWINRYTRHRGSSVPQKCEDRQRKLNGLRRSPFRIIIESLPVLLQLSLSLLGVALVLSLWDVNRVTASVVAGFTGLGALFYTSFSIAGMLSYESPFQTPISLTLRRFGVNRFFGKLFPKRVKRDPSADCLFWVLKRITDPEVTAAALKYLTDIRWHCNPPEQVPWLQVTRIYTNCFDASQRVLSESKEIAYAAGMALIQLYFHRLCSDVGSAGIPQIATNAFIHLCARDSNDNLRPLALIAKSVEKPDRNYGCRWDLSGFDLQWASEMWAYYAFICRRRLEPGQSGSIIEERNIPADLSAFFKKEVAPPPRVVRNIIRGLLVCINSVVPPLEDLIDHDRADNDSSLFQGLEDEMKWLADDKPPVLLGVLEPLRLWKHERVEVVTLCCHLLKVVVAKRDAEATLTRDIVYCLCQIAFRDLSPAMALGAAPLDLDTLDHLAPLVKNGERQFLDDVIPALSSFSWEREQQQAIIRMIFDAPVASFSQSQGCQTAAITVIGKAPLSVVKMIDRNKMLELVERLPVGTLVEQIIADESVRQGWMRLLLLYTCPRTPPDIHSHRSLWHILLALVDKRPEFFLVELSNHLTDRLLEGLDTDLGGLDTEAAAEIVEKRKVLWMKLLWSSRFFESDCESWADFELATTEFVRLTRGLLDDLLVLRTALGDSDTNPSPPYLKLKEIDKKVAQDTLPRPQAESTKPLSNATPPGKPPSRSNLEVRGLGEASGSGNPHQKPPEVAPKDTPPLRPPAPNNDPPPPQPHIAPQDTPPFRPGRRRPRSPARENPVPAPPGIVEVPLGDGSPSLSFWMRWRRRGHFD